MPFQASCYTPHCLDSEPVIGHQAVTHSHPISSLLSHGWGFQDTPNIGQDTEHCQSVFLLKTGIPFQEVGEEQLLPSSNQAKPTASVNPAVPRFRQKTFRDLSLYSRAGQEIDCSPLVDYQAVLG